MAARGYVWYTKANVPGFLLPVPVPVAHMDRKPHEGLESEMFTYKPASEWDEHWVGVDVPGARKLANGFLDNFTELATHGLLDEL